MQCLNIAIVVLCVALLALGLGVGYFRQVGNFGVETDFYGSFAPEAENIISGRGYTGLHHPPGYVLLLVGVSFLVGDLFEAGKVITAVALPLFGYITFLLVGAVFGERVAFPTALLLTLALIPYSFLAATDIPGAVLVLLPVWVLVGRETITLKASMGAGALAGMAYLMRSQAIFLVGALGLAIILFDVESESMRKRLKKALALVCGLLAVTSPWLIVNWKTNGSAFASTAYLQIAANYYHPDPASSQYGTAMKEAAAQFGSLFDVVAHDPWKFVSKWFKSVVKVNAGKLAVEGLGFPSYLFAGAGILLFLRDTSRKKRMFLLICLVGYLMLGLVGFHLRYYFFLFPFLFVSITSVVFHRGVLMGMGYRREALSWVVIGMLAIIVGKNSYDATSRLLLAEPAYLLEVSGFLRERSTKGETIIVRKPHLAYLAGLNQTFPLAQSADEYLKKAEEIGARYIAYSDFEASLWPGLMSLRDPEAVPRGLRLIYEHEPTHTLIYEVVRLAGGGIQDMAGSHVLREVGHISGTKVEHK